MKLTKTACERAEYPFDPTTERRFVLWDNAVRGFGLRVYPSNRKTFVFRCEVAGRQRWMQLGDFGPMTVQQARQRARRARVEADDGEDPVEARRQRRRQASTLGELARDFMAEIAAARKPKTARTYQQLLDAHILPRFGKFRPAAITEDDVAAFHRTMKGTPYAANRALWLLSKLMRIAEKRGLRRPGTNPSEDVKRYRETARKRYLSSEELVKIGDAISRLESEGVELASVGGRVTTVSTHAAAALRLLLFTGCRVNEVLQLRWEDIDFEHALVRLADTKTGERHMPLTAPALAVFDTIPRVPGNPWVVVGQNAGNHLTDLALPWRRVLEVAGLSGIRLHDLRHTVGAWAASSGLSLLLVGKLLGHRQAASTERYAHLAADPVREAAERVAAGIAAAMEGRQADVVTLDRR